ncbi:MAG: Hsp20/alpha crystallin family protein [bacterium]
MLSKEDISKEWEAGHLIAPSANIHETTDHFVMKILMPGVNKDGVEVKLADEELMIYRRVRHEADDPEKYLIKEIEDGNYYRVFRVTDAVEGDKIHARMEDGVLTVTLPKHERVKPKEIPIEAG